MYEIENIAVVIKPVSFEDFYDSMESQKYRQHYERLIVRAQGRTLAEYTEKHHIIPKCLGGVNTKSNYARLTASEHYVAHQLLVKLFPNEPKLIYAANMMTLNAFGLRGSNNKSYSWLRKKFSIVVGNRSRGVVPSAETIAKMSESGKRKIFSEEHRSNIAISGLNRKPSKETRDKMSASAKGKQHWLNKNHTEETKTKMSEGQLGKKRGPYKKDGRKKGPLTEETKDKISKSNTGKSPSEESRAKMREAKLGIKQTPEMIAKRVAGRKAANAAKKALRELLEAWSCAL